AASPHCAALAALVLQAHGGSKSLTPAQVKTIFQTTAFPHDLDPYSVSGNAQTANGGSVSITVFSDNSGNNGTGEKDPNSWSVTYTGPGTLTSLSFNPQGTPQTGGNVTGGNYNGITAADFLDSSKYKYTPGMVFTSAFTFGNKSHGLVPADVAVSCSSRAPPPSNPTPSNSTDHNWTLTLNFPKNNFTSGKVLRFNNGRQQQQDATSPQGVTNPPSTGSPVTNNIMRRSGDISFFFSSRRRHTRFDCDWSSDVCSSDLPELPLRTRKRRRAKQWFEEIFDDDYLRTLPFLTPRQTEREAAFIAESLGIQPGAA